MDVDQVELKQSPFAGLPKEVMNRILSHLDPLSLFRAGQTCKNWRERSFDETLWQRHCVERGFSIDIDNESYRETCIYKALQWIASPASVLLLGEDDNLMEFAERVRSVGRLSAFELQEANAIIDWSTPRLVIILANDVPYTRSSLRFLRQSLEGIHVAIYIHSTSDIATSPQAKSLREDVQLAGGRCISYGVGKSIEDMTVWNRKLWWKLEKWRGWPTTRKSFVHSRIAHPTQLPFFHLNRRNIAKGQARFASAHLQPKRSLATWMALLVAVIAVIYMYISRYRG